MVFFLINEQILLGDNETPSKLYCNWYDKTVVKYITTDADGTNHQYFISTKHPEKLTDDERYRVLKYCLGKFDNDEIVNYNDLFLQNEFIIEANFFKGYKLIDLNEVEYHEQQRGK